MRVSCFGHRDAPASVLPSLERELRRLIETEKADVFYVGGQGAFDRMAQRLLVGLCEEYPHIRATAVLSYMPQAGAGREEPILADTLFPSEVATAPPRFAISRRNRWMLKNSDAVLVYARCSAGGAAAMKRAAIAAGKRVFELAE